jgi:hypothetical protein
MIPFNSIWNFDTSSLDFESVSWHKKTKKLALNRQFFLYCDKM